RDLEPKTVATKRARDAVMETLATQVEQGAIDRAALEPMLDALRTSAADERSANHEAVARVSNILTAPQRSELKETLRQTHWHARRWSKHRSRQPGILRDVGLSREQKLQIRVARSAALKEFLQDARQHRGSGLARTPLPHIARRILFLE